MTWRADVFTLFPAMLPGPLGLSLAGNGLSCAIWSLAVHDIRDHGLGRHRAVDDTPAGGGAGMVMRADVVAASLDAHLPNDDPAPAPADVAARSPAHPSPRPLARPGAWRGDCLRSL